MDVPVGACDDAYDDGREDPFMEQALDRASLGDFLRARREALQPEDVGLRRGTRRRARGLRREEAAELCDMSADYFARLERGSGPQPSQRMAAAIARGLGLTPDERDHLFLLCGHRTPQRLPHSEHVDPGLMRILDRLQDTPAQIMGPLGETLLQTHPAVALLGEQTHYTGDARSAAYRWFTDPAARERYLRDDHELSSRVNVVLLRAASTKEGPGSQASRLVASLLRLSGSSRRCGTGRRSVCAGAGPDGSSTRRSGASTVLPEPAGPRPVAVPAHPHRDARHREPRQAGPAERPRADGFPAD